MEERKGILEEPGCAQKLVRESWLDVTTDKAGLGHGNIPSNATKPGLGSQSIGSVGKVQA